MLKLLFNKSIFDSNAQALVNPVNCVGVMGAGLALEFKQRHYRMYIDYVNDCNAGNMRLRDPRMYNTGDGGKCIICFPTKNHWKDKSNIDDIRWGLEELVTLMEQQSIMSIGLPMLGCGLGGLQKEDVLKLYYDYFYRLKLQGIDVIAEVYL